MLETLYEQHFGPKWVALSDVSKTYLLRRTLMHLFQLIGSLDFIRDLSKIDRNLSSTELHVFKSRLLSQGYILKNLKGYLYASVYNGCYTKSRCLKLAEAWMVEPRDAKLVTLVTGAFRDKLIALRDSGYKSIPLNTIDTNIRDVLLSLQGYMTRFVYRKMSFIVSSNGMEHADLVTELQVKTIQGLLLTYPKVESKLHFTNIAKRTLHNHGINLIHKYSSKGRGRLSQGKDGTFTTKIVQLETAMLNGDLRDDASMCCDAYGKADFSGGASDSLDLKLTVGKLVNSFEGRKRKFLNLLMLHDDDFTGYLRNRGIIQENETNEDLQDVDMDTYIHQASLFLNMTHDASAQVMNMLKTNLSDYCTQ